jgi:outer membrane lipoprotein-sorting protein
MRRSRKSKVESRKSAAALLLALLVVGTAPGAETDPAQLLAKIKDAYASTPSVSLTFVQTYTPAGFAAAQPETGRLVLQAPDQIRFDYDGPDGKVFTFDGVSARQYVAADKQMVLKSLSPSERARLPIVFLESPERLLARYDATVHAKPNGLVELVLKPKTEADPKSLTVLATDAGDVKRLSVLDAGGNETVFTFTQKVAGKKRPVTDFALVPPPGTKVVSE